MCVGGPPPGPRRRAEFRRSIRRPRPARASSPPFSRRSAAGACPPRTAPAPRAQTHTYARTRRSRKDAARCQRAVPVWHSQSPPSRRLRPPSQSPSMVSLSLRRARRLAGHIVRKPWRPLAFDPRPLPLRTARRTWTALPAPAAGGRLLCASPTATSDGWTMTAD